MCNVYWDDEGPAFWNETTRQARKEHRCMCCNTRILPGEKYVYISYVAERGDKPTVSKACLACDAIADKFGEEHEGKPGPRSLRRYVESYIAEGDEESQRWQPMLDQIDARRAAAGVA